ncbi:endolytic transglycosylase MltG [Patescibacteria group bacterium]|nr:endolytic transglycosylase MltG [Patescibacteria group bacterium]
MKEFFKDSHLVLFAVVFLVLSAYALFITPPRAYPSGTSITVPAGASVREAGELLEKAGAIRSSGAFTVLVRFWNPDGGVLANTYALTEKESALELAYRFAHGDTGIEPIRVTIPEGLTSREIGELLKERLGVFDAERFRILGEAEEGYLFPETYYLTPGTEPDAAVRLMKETFNEKVLPLEEKIRASGKSVHEVVTMGSLIEREARKPETRRIISDILWRRIELGMPLQVDAVFGYILGKSGYAPNFDDLKIESPYNTYLNRGLPPGPIANPGLDSILAAVEPKANEYLYYLTGKDGKMYYAKTFEKHVANRVHLK